jgi:hypothetical protein
VSLCRVFRAAATESDLYTVRNHIRYLKCQSGTAIEEVRKTNATWIFNHGFWNNYRCFRKNTFRTNGWGLLVSVSHIQLLRRLQLLHLVPIVAKYLQTLAQNTSFNVSAHPGILNIWGIHETWTDATFIKEYLDDNLVNIIGGCGTTPEHIKLIAEIAKDYKPRVSTAIM